MQTSEVQVGVVFTDPYVTVTAFPVDHKNAAFCQDDKCAFGYRIKTPDRVIVISGDTRPVDAVANACNGCDILFHEVVGGEGWVGAGGIPYGSHTSATELGEIAKKANPKLLVLYLARVSWPSRILVAATVR